jgi:hypothetical protein
VHVHAGEWPKVFEESNEVRAFGPLIRNRAWRLHQKLPLSLRRRVSLDELYVAGLLGAWRVVRKLRDGAQYASVSRMAATAIKNAMIDWMRTEGHWATSGQTTSVKYESLTSIREHYLGREAESPSAVAVAIRNEIAAVLCPAGVWFGRMDAGEQRRAFDREYRQRPEVKARKREENRRRRERVRMAS